MDFTFCFRDIVSQRNQTGTARLPFSLGFYCHPDLPDARHQLCALKGIFPDAVLEIFKVIHKTLVSFLQNFGTSGELSGEINRPIH